MAYATVLFLLNSIFSCLLAVVAASATMIMCLSWLLLEQTPHEKKHIVLASWSKYIADLFLQRWMSFTNERDFTELRKSSMEISDFDTTRPCEVLEELVITATKTYDVLEELVLPRRKIHQAKVKKRIPSASSSVSSCFQECEPALNKRAEIPVSNKRKMVDDEARAPFVDEARDSTCDSENYREAPCLGRRSINSGKDDKLRRSELQVTRQQLHRSEHYQYPAQIKKDKTFSAHRHISLQGTNQAMSKEKSNWGYGEELSCKVLSPTV